MNVDYKIAPRKRIRLTYPKIFALGYLALITLGTLLLLLPVCSRAGARTSLMDALYTATSATCVTGLVTVDTFTHWSGFGQGVILLLIQIGGLGFMTLLTLFSFFTKRKIGLKERGMLKESVNAIYIGGVVRLFRKILLGTLLIEGLGSLLLMTRLIPRLGWAQGVWFSIFHAISAFCNAGFDLMGGFGHYSSLVPLANDAVVLLTISALILVGGIGFFVWDDVQQNRLHFSRYRLHSKIAISVTLILTVFGTAFMFFDEYTNTLAGMPLWQKLVVSLFNAVTPRTAGFNAVDMTAMRPASRFLTMVYMFIGGSSGSTAGGIKTTTVAVLCISAWSTLFGKHSDNVFNRRLDNEAVKRSVATVMISLSLIVGAVLLLGLCTPDAALWRIVYEALSASGTVGLTAGITAQTNVFGRIVLMFLMYVGRVGSLSLSLVFTERKPAPPTLRPVEKISIG